jgi:hypothetical protein
MFFVHSLLFFVENRLAQPDLTISSQLGNYKGLAVEQISEACQ